MDSDWALRQAVEFSPVPMAIVDGAEGRYIFINRQFVELFGWGSDELRSVLDWWPRAYPSEYYRKRIRHEWIDRCQRAVRDKKPIVPVEARITCKDGSIRHAEVHFANIGEIDVITFVDLTERRRAHQALLESERFLGSIVDNTPDMICVKDAAELRYVQCNKAGEDLLGLSRHDLQGKTAWDLFSADEARQITENDVKALRGGRLLVTPEETIESRTHGPRVLHTKRIPLRGPDGRSAYLLSVSDDITTRRQVEEALRHQALALEDANTALRVVLEQRSQDRAEVERTILSNAETVLMPLLGNLRKRLAQTPEAAYLDAATLALKELVCPLIQSYDTLAGSRVQLTLRESEIATLIRAGKSSCEIAEALHISPATVAFHRKSLRRKLGLGPRTWLAAHLARLPFDEDASEHVH